MKYALFPIPFAILMHAQEANSGFDLRATLSAASVYSEELGTPPRDASSVSGGFRAMLYPTWKLSSHWAVSGAMQIHSRPYFTEEFETQGYGTKGDLLQLNLSYARFWKNRSLVIRAGQLSSAFGAFPARYDSAENPLIGIPAAYGYYYRPVTLLGLAGAQADAAVGKLDARAQFVNSSPANRRSVFDGDQYGNWAGGAGYTIRQGFRVGGSFYYGPYLHRQYAYYFRGEANPRDLPALGYGVDAQWGHGPWNAWGEWQRFQMDYRLIPTFKQHIGYAEIRRVVHPRWFVAARAGYRAAFRSSSTYEIGAGFRPNVHQLLKFSYQIQRGEEYPGTLGNTAAVEFVTSFRAFSFTRR